MMRRHASLLITSFLALYNSRASNLCNEKGGFFASRQLLDSDHDYFFVSSKHPTLSCRCRKPVRVAIDGNRRYHMGLVEMEADSALVIFPF